MYIPVSGWFAAFVLTLAVEVPIAAVLLRRTEPSWARLLLLIVFVNLATHPVVWFVVQQLFIDDTTTYTVVAEGWAVAAESVFYWAAFRDLPLRRAIAVSIAANAASFLIGWVVTTNWPDLFS